MITLAAASQKGGVAKTTTNLAIGGKLAADGAGCSTSTSTRR